jgi:hypothetical protein
MPLTKLNHKQRREAARRFIAGESANSLAEEFGVTAQLIYSLKWEAMKEPEEKLEDARDELEFRDWIVKTFES